MIDEIVSSTNETRCDPQHNAQTIERERKMDDDTRETHATRDRERERERELEVMLIVRDHRRRVEGFIISSISIKMTMIKGTRRSRTTARSESSTSPTNHRPAIESSSSSRWLASSMMVHIDGDAAAKRTCLAAIDWLQSHALDCLP